MLNPPDCLFFLEAVPLWWQSQIHSVLIWMVGWAPGMLSVCENGWDGEIEGIQNMLP